MSASTRNRRPHYEGQSRMSVEWTSSDGCSMVVLYLTAEDARTVAHSLGLRDGAAKQILRLADRCDADNGAEASR